MMPVESPPSTPASPSSSGSAAPRRPRRLLVLCAIGFIAIIAGAVAWDQLKYNFFPKRFGIVEPGLIYRSGQISPSLIHDVLTENKIRVVVDTTGLEPGNQAQVAETKAIRELDIESFRFPLSGDGTGKLDNYAKAIAEMHEAQRAGKPLLLHCSAGTQRTGGIVAAYRVLVQKRPASEAIEEMEQYGFSTTNDKKLLDYLNNNLGDLARRLVELGVIDSVPDPLPVFNP